MATRRNSMWPETTLTGWRTTELDPRSAGSTDGIRVEGGGWETLSIRRRDLDHKVSQPYVAWKRSAESARMWRQGRIVAKTAESSIGPTMVAGRCRWSAGICGEPRRAWCVEMMRAPGVDEARSESQWWPRLVIRVDMRGDKGPPCLVTPETSRGSVCPYAVLM